MLFLAEKADALSYIAQMKSTTVKEAEENVANIIENKIELITSLRTNLHLLNDRMKENQGIEVLDLTIEDIRQYEDLYNSDNDSSDEDADDDIDNPLPLYGQIDARFSGKYNFFTDVRKIFAL